MSQFRPTELHVQLDQIVANYECLASMSKYEFRCPMLKANAYGHGAVQVAQSLEEVSCHHFGVALYEEAIELRKAGITKSDILVFAPMTKGAAQAAVDFNLTPVVLSDGDLEILETELKGRSAQLRLHLKLNFSMNRLGFKVDKATQLIQKIDLQSNLELEGLCTHFPNAEDLLSDESQTRSEIDIFLQFISSQSVKYAHALNSSAIVGLNALGDEVIHQMGMRPGIALYGAVPEMGKDLNLPIHEAMTLRSRVQHIQKLKKAEAVSYMGQWVAPEDSTIGIIPIGYADGIRRGLSGKIPVRIDGEDCPQVGVICMDYVMVNLTHLKKQNLLGARAELLIAGDTSLSAQTWAKKLNTIPYEIMTSMGQRLPRTYL